MARPEVSIERVGQGHIPIELAPDPMDFNDGIERWASATAVTPTDRLRIKSMGPGVAIKFANCIIANPPGGAGIVIVRSDGTFSVLGPNGTQP